jgi:hypothetical protein
MPVASRASTGHRSAWPTARGRARTPADREPQGRERLGIPTSLQLGFREIKDPIAGARESVRGQPSGHHEVEETWAELFPSGHTSRSWGRIIRHGDETVEDEPGPWLQADS